MTLTKNTTFVWGGPQSQSTAVGPRMLTAISSTSPDKFTLIHARRGARPLPSARRAMELDIHHDMLTANLFAPAPRQASLVNATKLLPTMTRPHSATCNP